MPPLPVISGREAAKALQKIGFLFHHQKGSHMIYYRPDGRHLSIPDHRSLIAELYAASSKARELR
ncbi:MAG TPA: type II toxin-antitoxin system HicA family toxin [Candidatus Binatia bacterium]|nr:type II toxin-antitoxin system HicA family toxin [Candidatus Binatia bacterium]